MRIAGLLIAALIAGVAVQATASACPAGGAVFQDSFADASGGWEADTNLKYGSGTGLQVQLPPNGTNDPELNAMFLAPDGDFCTDAVFPSTTPTYAASGLIFWATDYNNYYLMAVTSKGHAQLFKRSNGAYITVYDEQNAAVKTVPSSTNELRVTANANLATLYVNGQKYLATRAQAPQGTAIRFGLFEEVDPSTAAGAARLFTFKDYTVNGAP